MNLFTQHCLLQIDECKTLVDQLIAQLEGDSVLSLEFIKSMCCTMSFTWLSFDGLSHEAMTDLPSTEDRNLLELAQLIDF